MQCNNQETIDLMHILLRDMYVDSSVITPSPPKKVRVNPSQLLCPLPNVIRTPPPPPPPLNHNYYSKSEVKNILGPYKCFSPSCCNLVQKLISERKIRPGESSVHRLLQISHNSILPVGDALCINDLPRFVNPSSVNSVASTIK